MILVRESRSILSFLKSWLDNCPTQNGSRTARKNPWNWNVQRPEAETDVVFFHLRSTLGIKGGSNNNLHNTMVMYFRKQDWEKNMSVCKKSSLSWWRFADKDNYSLGVTNFKEVFSSGTMTLIGDDDHQSGNKSRCNSIQFVSPTRDSPDSEISQNSKSSDLQNIVVAFTLPPTASGDGISQPGNQSINIDDHQSTGGEKLVKLTQKETLTILSLAYGNFCLGTLYAILAPFFPHEVIS